MPIDRLQLDASATVRAEPREARLRPIVFLGLGGTGLKVLSRLKLRFRQSFGEPEGLSVFKMLCLDADANDLENARQGAFGYPLRDADLINVGMTAEQVATVRNGLEATHRHVGAWISPHLRQTDNPSFVEGAKQLRYAGRLLLTYHLDTIRQKLNEACRHVTSRQAIDALPAHVRVSDDRGGVPDPDVMVVASLAGGTGAGGFLDAAFLAQALRLTGQANLHKVLGFLLLPDAFARSDDPLQDVMLANGFAALKELEHYSNWQPFDVKDWGDQPWLEGFAADRQRRLDRPFQDVHLFSADNGVRLTRPEELYELIADLMAFSVGDSRVARQIRSWLVNAEPQAEQALRQWQAPLPEEDEPPEWVQQQEATGRFRRYECTWGAHYAAAGLARITQKLPELRRLAGTRLLVRLAEMELGPDPETLRAQNAPLESQEAYRRDLQRLTRLALDHDPLFSPQDEQKLLQGCEQTITAATNTAQMEADLRSLFHDIRGWCLDVQRGGSERPKVRQFLQNAAAAGRDTAQRLLEQVDGSWNLHRALQLVGQIHQDVTQQKPAVSVPEAFTGSPWLARWQELEAAGVNPWWDLFAFGLRAQRILRQQLVAEVRDRMTALVAALRAGLEVVYLDAVAGELSGFLDRLRRRVEPLREFRSRMSELQGQLARSFDEQRNLVLTAHLAAQPDDADAQAQLDAELHHALGGQDDAAWQQARQAVLTRTAGRRNLAETPATLFDALQDTASSPVINQLPYHAADTLTALPSTKGVVPWLERWQQADPDGYQRQLNAFAHGAAAYWPIDTSREENRGYLEKSLFSGTPQKHHVWDSLAQRFPQPPWEFVALEADPEHDEVVIATSRQGLALPSLQHLPLMHTAYEKLKRQRGAANRHLDRRLVERLLPLLYLTHEAIHDEVRRMDIALLGVVLGLFPWQPGQGFRFLREGGQWTAVGADVPRIAAWLAAAGTDQRQAIERQINGYFNELAGQPAKLPDPEQATRTAERNAETLLRIDAVLELLGHKVFPGGENEWPAEHTRIHRLRRRWVARKLRPLLSHLPDFDAREARWRFDVKKRLHQHATFVGSLAGENIDERIEHQEVVPQPITSRILQLREEPHPDANRVLLEAWSLGWYRGQVAEPFELRDLFPELTDPAEAAGGTLRVPAAPTANPPPAT